MRFGGEIWGREGVRGEGREGRGWAEGMGGEGRIGGEGRREKGEGRREKGEGRWKVEGMRFGKGDEEKEWGWG